MRIVTSYKTPSVLREYLRSFFPSSAVGQKFFSTHKVFINGVLHDKSLVHSSTYIAKEGHIVHFFGYTKPQIRELIVESKRYNKMLKIPVYEKIIMLYDISHPNQIPEAIRDYYDSIEKIPPKNHIVAEMIRQIMYKVSLDYRKKYLKDLQQMVFELSCYDKGY